MSLDLRYDVMRFFLQRHKVSRLEALLQDVEATTHNVQQQALDQHVDEAKAAKRAAKNAEKRDDQQWSKLATLIPSIGHGCRLKLICNEQSKRLIED